MLPSAHGRPEAVDLASAACDTRGQGVYGSGGSSKLVTPNAGAQVRRAQAEFGLAFLTEER